MSDREVLEAVSQSWTLTEAAAKLGMKQNTLRKRLDSIRIRTGAYANTMKDCAADRSLVSLREPYSERS